MEREIEGYKKSNNEEQEKNEKLTVQQYWLDMECGISEKQINQTQVKKEAVQAHYGACLRTLEETTRSLDMLRKVEANAASVIHGRHLSVLPSPLSPHRSRKVIYVRVS